MHLGLLVWLGWAALAPATLWADNCSSFDDCYYSGPAAAAAAAGAAAAAAGAAYARKKKKEEEPDPCKEDVQRLEAAEIQRDLVEQQIAYLKKLPQTPERRNQIRHLEEIDRVDRQLKVDNAGLALEACRKRNSPAPPKEQRIPDIPSDAKVS